MTIAELETRLSRVTTAGGWAWLKEAKAEVAASPAAVRVRFPAVGRCVGRQVLEATPPGGVLFAWTADTAGRAVLLEALGDAADRELEDLYRHGDADERRAVLRWIGLLPDATPLQPVATDLVGDALRSNDLRLIAAALGPWAVRTLPFAVLNQAVLKCVFLGIPLVGLDGLRERANPELARMVAAYVHERVAAGRDAPAEVWGLIDRFPPTEELRAIEAELTHPVAARRAAARAVLDARRSCA